MNKTMDLPGTAFRARRTVPGDKSLSHRALILAAMASGQSTVRGLGPGQDIAATRTVLRAVGVDIGGGYVDSPGWSGWRAPAGVLDAGNSGTTMRLMAGVLAGHSFTSVLDGDASLRRRPMARLQSPLEALGATVTPHSSGTPPLEIRGRPLTGAAVNLDVASAQVRSAVELAAVNAAGATTVDSPPGFRDHTERWLGHLGRGRWESPTRFRIDPGPVPTLEVTVPGDPSSAAFLWAAAAAVPGAVVTTPGISLNPGRTGFAEVLATMGASVEIAVTGDVLGDPVGDVTVTGARLRGITISAPLTVRVLDELPLVAVLGGLAAGPTRVTDAAELRVKESDRIASMAAAVAALGGTVSTAADGFTVGGGATYGGGEVQSAHDHRVAMAAAVAAVAATGPVVIHGAEIADVSWPGFFDVLEGLWSSP